MKTIESTSINKTSNYNEIIVNFNDSPCRLSMKFQTDGKWTTQIYTNLNGKWTTKGPSVKSSHPIWEQDNRRNVEIKKILEFAELCKSNSEKSEIILTIIDSITQEMKDEISILELNENFLPDEFTYISNVKYTTFINKMKESHYVDDETSIIVTLAAMFTHMDKVGRPVWLMVIAPASGGKTKMLELLTPHFLPNKFAHPISNVTSRSFLSGLSDNIDLLPRMNGKIMVCKDLSTILESEDSGPVLNILREAYDGHVNFEFGSGIGHKGWSGFITVIAGMTPEIDSYTSIQANLGERFIRIRQHSEIGNVSNKKYRDEITKKAAESDVSMEESIKKELSDYLLSMMCDFEEASSGYKPPIKGRSSLMLQNCAKITGTLRTGIKRDFHKNVETTPEPEFGPRLVKSYKKIAVSLAWLLGKKEVDVECLSYIYRISLDTIEKRRVAVLQALKWEPQKAQDISEIVKLPTNTLKLILEDLWMLGLVNKEKEEKEEVPGEEEKKISSNTPWLWSYNRYSDVILFIMQVETLLSSLASNKKHHTLLNIEIPKDFNKPHKTPILKINMNKEE